MDEELGVKAPVTRLRRRLSTEAEGAQSPLTPSTPTKKRGTRIAKPALELIDEDVTEAATKKVTCKTSTKDVEPMKEKPVTPSRRSSRIRSNTSLLLEATQNIVADSPRAKRASRRNSQIGSDTETVTTPARRTRTRKDSASSVEKLGVTITSNEKVVAQVAEAIYEEQEKDISKDKLNTSQNLTPIRKSPRLNKRDKKTVDEPEKDGNITPQQNDNSFTKPSTLTEDTSSLNGITIEATNSNTHENRNGKPKEKDSEIQNISLNSVKLKQEITTNPKQSTDFNKTVSAIDDSNNDKGKRKRTKSWTTVTANDTSTENINSPTKFASGDSIGEKVNYKSSNKSINKSASIHNTSIENEENVHIIKSESLSAGDTIKILENTPCKDLQTFVFIEDSDSNSGKLTIDIRNGGEGEKNNGGDQCVPVVKQTTPKRLTSESFVVEPMDIDETIPENVTIDDFSDKSNSSIQENQKSELKQNSLQFNEKSFNVSKNSSKSTRISICLEQETNKSKRKSSITASEENDFKDALDNSSISNKSQRKSSISVLYENNNMTEQSNKSKRKSSFSKVDSNTDKRKSSTSSEVEKQLNESSNKSKRKSESGTEMHNPENSLNENKSTLVLSQLKDVSTNETSNVSKSQNNTINELSKSINIPTLEIDKKNKSNYLTSTPLNQKPLQKLAMQINTSLISPNIDAKNTSKANKSKTPVKNVSNVSHDTDSSDESDEDSREKSGMIDDEAEEASDDYQSGDSRDAEEIQYERDHEITEKGETLESELESVSNSDDSDYEKDSFIVSSDEEDKDLLSGSGDDLSLSDNELNMTAKSKNKFNKRKQKEQKNASREMFESRHQLKDSKNSKGNKIQSSASESEETKPKPKKNNRLRIDSSHDVSMNNSDADESVHVKKKKTKRLSESVCEDNPNEKEVTIHNQSVFDRNDPLEVAIKQEPKTPQKDFNISTVQINDNIELIQVDTNASVMNPNETSDPLQATQAHEDGESDSDISENMEITENYDSVLENLNKANNNNKIKTGDTSLNLNKKAKDKIKEPIVDQLNLTQTKKSKKVKAQTDTTDNATAKSNKIEVLALENKDDGDNSDSIDMRLLFPEDSNDSEANASKCNPDHNKVPVDEFIPLKGTEAKTNLREGIEELEETGVNFFIDTKGAFEEMDSTQNSAKKNKKKRKQNVSLHVEDDDHLTAPGETSVNDSLKKDKKKKKNKASDVPKTDKEPILNLLEVSTRYEPPNFLPEETANNSLNKEKKKRKKNNPHDVSHIDEFAAPEETSINVSVNSEKRKKKNKSLLEVSETVENAVSEETSINISVNREKKKKKKLLADVFQIVEDAAFKEPTIDVSMNSEKKNKKRNKSLDVSTALEIIDTEEAIANVSQNREKKKKNKSQNAEEIEEITAPEETKDVSQTSTKKKKKKKPLDVFQAVDNTGEESDEAPLEVSYESRKQSDNPEPIEDDDTLNKSKNKFKKKKKKNRKRQPLNDSNIDHDEGNAKKRKHDQSSPTTDNLDDAEGQTPQNKKKKKKLSQNDEGDNSVPGGSISKSNKRKAAEDVSQRNSKVFKGNFFEKVHVSRLPESIVNQLDDQPTHDAIKPKKSKKKKGIAISTLPFIVEEGLRRKNKPSTYLEQSIYLNDSISPVQQKKKIKNPKVLPYTPTVITSGTGFTSKFKINVLPQETQFVAQASNITNFREEYLSKQRAKKLRVERFKKQRNDKYSKF